MLYSETYQLEYEDDIKEYVFDVVILVAEQNGFSETWNSILK